MSLNGNGSGDGVPRKRKVNPALLLGGGGVPGLVGDGEFPVSKPVVGEGVRFGGSGGSGGSGTVPVPGLPVNEDTGFAVVPEGSDAVVPSRVEPVSEGEGVGGVSKPGGFFLPGDVKPDRKPVSAPLPVVGKGEGKPVPVLPVPKKLQGGSGEGSLVAGEGSSVPVVPAAPRVRSGSSDVKPPVVGSSGSGGSKPGGFFLPGEVKPKRKPVVKDDEGSLVVEPVEGEGVSSLEGSSVEAGPVVAPVVPVVPEVEGGSEGEGDVVPSGAEPVSEGKGVGGGSKPGGFFLPGEVKPERKTVNPLLSTGEREAVKPVARPSFFLDTDKIPAKRPVDFSQNKGKTVEPVVGDEGDREVVNPVEGGSSGWRKTHYVSKVEGNVEPGDWAEDDEGTEFGLGGEVDVRYVEPQYGKGFHLTERDIVLMKFMARYRYAYVDQLARLVDSIPRNIVNRLRVLEKRGFVRREALTDRQYLWTVRKAGLLLVDVPFREIKKGSLSYATIAHTIGLCNLAVELEREAGGKDILGEGKGVEGWVMPSRRWKLGIRDNPDGLVPGEMTVSEREIRQGQMRWRGNRSYKELREIVDAAVVNPDAPELEEDMEGLFVVYGPGGKGGEHVPDLVISRERDEFGRPQHIAIELELTQKTPAEWRKILRNYRDNGLMYSKVYYFTHKKSIANALMRLAEDEGFGDKMVVRKYTPSNSKLPFWG